MMLSSNDLLALRAQALELMPSSCVIGTSVVVADGGGGQEETFTPGDPIPCRLAPVAGGEKGTAGDRIDARTTHILTLPAEATVDARDRATVDGREYEILAVRRRPDWEVATRCEVIEGRLS